MTATMVLIIVHCGAEVSPVRCFAQFLSRISRQCWQYHGERTTLRTLIFCWSFDLGLLVVNSYLLESCMFGYHLYEYHMVMKCY